MAVVTDVADDVVLVRADNPGPMTLDGTNTWIVRGTERTLVIDPGPAEPGHLGRVNDAVARFGPRPAAVLLTHGHADHSESAAAFAASLAASLHAANWPDAEPFDAHLLDAEVQVLNTPGHTSDSVSFVVAGHLFTGDTVLGRGTTVVAHPDGRLADYLTSLHLLAGVVADLSVATILPGHGPVVAEPSAAIAGYLAHREQRLAAVQAAAQDASGLQHDALVEAIVVEVYRDVPTHLWPAAALSVRAQVDYLRETGAI